MQLFFKAELSALGSDDDDKENTGYESVSGRRSIPNTQSKPEKNVPLIVQPSPVAAGHSVLNLLNERLKMYENAKQNALAADDSSRAIRYRSWGFFYCYFSLKGENG